MTLESVRVPAELERLAHVRAVLRRFTAGCGASSSCTDDLVQAVDEAATNAIVHGYRGAPGWIDLTAACVGDRIVVTLEDTAPTFDPAAVPEPDTTIPPDRRRPGGMGVHLMRIGTDSIEHRPRPGGGNILTMTRRLDPST